MIDPLPELVEEDRAELALDLDLLDGFAILTGLDETTVEIVSHAMRWAYTTGLDRGRAQGEAAAARLLALRAAQEMRGSR